MKNNAIEGANDAIEGFNKATKLKDEAMKLVNSYRSRIDESLNEYPEISKNLDATLQSTIAGNMGAMEHFAEELLKKEKYADGNK